MKFPSGCSIVTIKDNGMDKNGNHSMTIDDLLHNQYKFIENMIQARKERCLNCVYYAGRTVRKHSTVDTCKRNAPGPDGFNVTYAVCGEYEWNGIDEY